MIQSLRPRMATDLAQPFLEGLLAPRDAMNPLFTAHADIQ